MLLLKQILLIVQIKYYQKNLKNWINNGRRKF
jgi:hypothetical protein